MLRPYVKTDMKNVFSDMKKYFDGFRLKLLPRDAGPYHDSVNNGQQSASYRPSLGLLSETVRFRSGNFKLSI